MIGAAVPLTKVFSIFEKNYPDFGLLLQRFASQQIRNLASFGGNLANASAVADTPPALLVWDACFVLAKAAKTRTIPAKDFFIGYKKTAAAKR